MEGKILEVVNILKKSINIVVLTGAGISAESGIPTYRGSGGLWSKFKMEDMAAPDTFEREPEMVWKWYGERQKKALECKPNKAHEILAKLEKDFPNFTLITQNIDNLHQRAGSDKVLELHGNLFKARCTNNECIEAQNPIDFILKENPLPKCSKCKSLLRPHIVWFGEPLDHGVISKAFQKTVDGDTFIVIGTSVQVRPAADLPMHALDSGSYLIEINLEKTPVTNYANVSLIGKAGEMLSEVWDRLKKHE